VAGPWFTVQRSAGDWQQLDKIWISNGTSNDRARVELRVEFEETNDETANAG
jgi:hypothetical protein